ncbi:MAG: HD domain-containing protein [Flammeovirgaceae bacterium]|nr:HD domain-containing protein [Flammeovirgaceae bacterium]
MKSKTINDPLYGFITINTELVFEIIQHPFFQRLRHIKQLGLTDMVYPAALHSRFQHALGAYYLMGKVLDNLRQKGIEISYEEYEASRLAILLHDIGHGPFSHALEETLLHEINHESISYLVMDYLNKEFKNALNLTIKIFRNTYARKFFHQLVSSQLDIDRLDYLHRDCFFTGVMEGKIGLERILSILTVHNDELVVEEKGIYSIENFLTARRLMYWQVYLHKTALSAERMLVNTIQRARYLLQAGEQVGGSETLIIFLKQNYSLENFKHNVKLLTTFCRFDDLDIWGGLKLWQSHTDPILSLLAGSLLQRKLFQITLTNAPISKAKVDDITLAISQSLNVLRAEARFLFSHGSVSNEGYNDGQKINLLTRDGELIDIAKASDLPNVQALSKIVKKNYLCWPKNVSL